jgi:hypothetical protein
VAGRTHNAVADCKTGHALPKAFDFARAFEAQNRARAADRAMLMAGEHQKIGTVERGGLHAHANFARAGRRVSTMPIPALFLSATTMARIVSLPEMVIGK